MHFKAFFTHDLLNKDPEKRKKKTGLIIEIGYCCGQSCWCPHGRKCKYQGRWKFHNVCVRIQNFFRYKLKWKNFKISIYFQKHYTDLSGTVKCPHHMPRVKTCWDCIYSSGDRNCTCEERNKLWREGRWREYDCDDEWNGKRRCKFWTPVKWFQNYDRKTGDHIWSK